MFMRNASNNRHQSMMNGSLALIKQLAPLATGSLLCVGSLVFLGSNHEGNHSRRRLNGDAEKLQRLEDDFKTLKTLDFKSKECQDIFQAQIDSLRFKSQILAEKPGLYKDLEPAFQAETAMFTEWLQLAEDKSKAELAKNHYAGDDEDFQKITEGYTLLDEMIAYKRMGIEKYKKMVQRKYDELSHGQTRSNVQRREITKAEAALRSEIQQILRKVKELKKSKSGKDIIESASAVIKKVQDKIRTAAESQALPDIDSKLSRANQELNDARAERDELEQNLKEYLRGLERNQMIRQATQRYKNKMREYFLVHDDYNRTHAEYKRMYFKNPEDDLVEQLKSELKILDDKVNKAKSEYEQSERELEKLENEA